MPRRREPFQFGLGGLFCLISFLAVCLALIKWMHPEDWSWGTVLSILGFWPLMAPFYAFLVLYVAAWVFYYRGWRCTGITLVFLGLWIFIVGLFVVAFFLLPWLAW